MEPSSVWDEEEVGPRGQSHFGVPTSKIGSDPNPAVVVFQPSDPELPESERRRELGSTDIRRRPRARSYVAATATILVGVFLADGAYAAAQVRSGLQLAADYLTEARQSLSAGEADAALDQARAALASTQRARASISRPSFALGSYLPFISEDVKAVGMISLASEEAASAAIAGATAASSIGLSGEGVLPSILDQGTVDLDALEAASPFVIQADDALNQASEVLAEPVSPRVEIIAAALNDARTLIDEARVSTSKAVDVFDTLPPLLGADKTQRYLLAFQALGEARATGGLIGLVGTLEARSGTLTLADVSPVQEVFPEPLTASVDAPLWFRASYERQAALRQIQQANVSPNLPVVGDVLLNMIEEQQGRSLDGILMMDPVALQGFLSPMDPIRSESFAAELNGSNAAQVILHDSYLEFESEAEQNAFLADVVDQFWQRVTDGSFDPVGFAASLDEVSASGHLKMYVREPSLQESLASLALTGGYPVDVPNPQMVFHNNYGVNKVDYFLHRAVHTEVELTDDGNAEVTVTARLENQASASPPSLLIGDGGVVPPGVNRALLSFQLPETATQIELENEGQEPQRWVEDRYPVMSTLLRIPPGGTTEVTVTYFLPAAFDITAPNPSFFLALLPHTSVNPDTVSWQITPPPGFSIASSPGSTLGEEGAQGEALLERLLAIRMDMTRESSSP